MFGTPTPKHAIDQTSSTCGLSSSQSIDKRHNKNNPIIQFVLITAILVCAEGALGAEALALSKKQLSSVKLEHERKKENLRANIARVEKVQPEWNSAPIKEELNKTDGGRGSSPMLVTLACQTPFLDMQLFKAAFDVSPPWHGGDTSYLLNFVPLKNQILDDYLARFERDQKDVQVGPMRTLLSQAVQEFLIGNTDEADRYYFELLKLAEQSGNYEITTAVLECYQYFLYGMCHRSNQKLYAMRRSYVFSERTCVESDHDFFRALNKLDGHCDFTVIKNLRAIQSELVRSRRSGDYGAAELQYTKLFDEAKKSGDKTGAVAYFALNAHHAFLMTQPSEESDYKELRSQLFSFWISEELGKQKSLAEINKRAGGDWSRLEAVFSKLEKQSIFVGRSIKLCSQWGLGDLGNVGALQNEQEKCLGMVFYQQPADREKTVWLICRPRLDTKTCVHCSNHHGVKNGLRPVVNLLTKTLAEAGFKTTRAIGHPDSVAINGEWTQAVR